MKPEYALELPSMDEIVERNPLVKRILQDLGTLSAGPASGLLRNCAMPSILVRLEPTSVCMLARCLVRNCGEGLSRFLL